VQRYAGSLIEFSGDGFVALFGALVAQEDHAQRAVRAALDAARAVGCICSSPQASARRAPGRVSGTAYGPRGS
jgi:class 3 adenylate cyclase